MVPLLFLLGSRGRLKLGAGTGGEALSSPDEESDLSIFGGAGLARVGCSGTSIAVGDGEVRFLFCGIIV